MRHDRRSFVRASATNVEANSNRSSFCLTTSRYKRQNAIMCSEALCRVAVNNKNHAGEDGRAAESASDEGGRGSPDRLLEVRSASNDPPRGIPQSATAIFSFCRKPSLPHCHVLAPPVGDHLSEFTKTGHPFSSPYVGDSAPGERHAVCHDCGDLGAYQFGINTHLRKSGCRSFTQRSVGSYGGES
jgi:hypothetical protein